MQNKRPKHLNLLKIKQPLPAIVSILHRISGLLLFFPGIPLLLCTLQTMLDSHQSHEEWHVFISDPVVKIGITVAVWMLMHHLCAGIRHLALDLHYGTTLAQARASSKAVLVAGVILTMLIGSKIW